MQMTDTYSYNTKILFYFITSTLIICILPYGFITSFYHVIQFKDVFTCRQSVEKHLKIFMNKEQLIWRMIKLIKAWDTWKTGLYTMSLNMDVCRYGYIEMIKSKSKGFTNKISYSWEIEEALSLYNLSVIFVLIENFPWQ